jgi:hypothetical protein
MEWRPQRRLLASAPQALYLPTIIDPDYHYEKVNVEASSTTRGSLLWWMRRMIALRKRYRVFGRGELKLLHPDNNKVLALVRQDEARRYWSSRTCRARPVRRTRPVGLRRDGARRTVRRYALPAHRQDSYR